MTQEGMTDGERTAMEEILVYASTMMMLGSNAIERAGLKNFAITQRICKDMHYTPISTALSRSIGMQTSLDQDEEKGN